MEVTGWSHCWRSPRGTPTPARRCSSPRPFGRRARGDKHAVSETRFLWVDVDRPDGLPRAMGVPRRAPLPPARREQRRSRARLLEARPSRCRPPVSIESTGELVEPIERAHLRLIHHLGTGADGKPNVADPACAERSRVMRLAGSVNGKTGAHARILEADLALPGYPIRQLVGDLPDPVPPAPPRVHASGRQLGPVQADRPARVLRATRRDRRPARRARPLPSARGPGPVLLGRDGREPGVAMPRRRLRGTGRDLRPRVGAARRAVGPAAARRGVQACPRVRDRRVRRANRRPRRDGERPTR